MRRVLRTFPSSRRSGNKASLGGSCREATDEGESASNQQPLGITLTPSVSGFAGATPLGEGGLFLPLIRPCRAPSPRRRCCGASFGRCLRPAAAVKAPSLREHLRARGPAAKRWACEPLARSA